MCVFVRVTVLRFAGQVDTCQVRVIVARVPRARAVTVTGGAVVVIHTMLVQEIDWVRMDDARASRRLGVRSRMFGKAEDGTELEGRD